MAHTKDVLKKHKNVPKEKKKKTKRQKTKKIYIPYITRGAKVVMGGAKVGNCTPLPPWLCLTILITQSKVKKIVEGTQILVTK